jgi:hypothetical protein
MTQEQLDRWHWYREAGCTQSMIGARQCDAIWHIVAPLPGFAIRVFRYRDGETTIYRGASANGVMDYLGGYSGAHALQQCFADIRQAWAMHLAKLWANVD